MSRSIKISIVDDHLLLLESMQLAARRDEEVSINAVFERASELTAYLDKNPTDVVVTGTDLKDTDGIVVIQRIKRQYPDIKVMLLAVNEDPSMIQRAVDNGVDGIQLKSCRFNDFIQSVKIVASGQKYYAPQVLRIVSSRPATDSHAGLSSREIEIMQMLSQGLSARSIGEKLLISARTVETHKANIMRKLNVNKATHLVKIAFDRGLVKAGIGEQS